MRNLHEKHKPKDDKPKYKKIMKKALLLLAFLSAMFCGFSQTTVDTALPLQEGDNSYTFENSGGSQTVYYTYTAPEGQGKLVEFTSTNSSVSSQMSLDGTYSTSITGINTNNYRTVTYPVKPGQSVILAVNAYNVQTAEFTIKLIDADVDAGSTCDDAIVLTEESAFMPSYYDRSSYTMNPAYLSYTCEEDGLLVITFSGSVSGCTAQIGCDATTTESVTVSSSSGVYVGKYKVEAGNTYIFKVSTYSSLFVSAELTHPVVGQSCDMPFDGAATNVLPKEAGKYWYSYTTDKAGFMTVSSENSLAGGTLSIWASCSAYSPDATIDGYFALRSRVYANYTYLICVEKNEATAEDETFAINVEEEKAGDSHNNPLDVTIGEEITVPVYNGDYYYRVTVPEGDSRFLIVDGTSANITNTATQVGVYTQQNTYSPLVTGKDYVKTEVTGSTVYVIKWTCKEGYNGFKFTVSYEEIAQGETCNNPFEAVVGANDLAAGSDKYYTYTATQDGWLTIDTDITIEVSFLKGCDTYSGTYLATKVATITKTELKTGQTCIIKFSNIDEETIFFLSEEDYQEGESCEKAIDVTLGSTAIPSAAGSYWYKYTAEQSGMLTIASDIIYERSADYSRQSAVNVLTSCDAYPTNITKSSAEGTIFEGSFVMNEGDVMFINVVPISAQSDKTLTLTMRDLNPGEACSNPIDITPGELKLPITSRTSPVWYGIQLEVGTFSITSTNYEYYSMSLYDSCDATNYLANSQYDGEAMGYSLKYDVTTAGYYLLKLEGTYNEITVTVDGVHTSVEGVKEDSNLRVRGNNIEVSVENTRTDVAICDVTGKIVASQAVYNNATFTLERGIYIVKIGDKVTKVAIR